MTDQPRDIHGTPIYVGDRVAIAVEEAGYTFLIVRLVTAVEDGLVLFPECGGMPDRILASDARYQALRLP